MERLPPYSLEGEEATIGSILIDPDAIAKLSRILRPEHFFRETHAQIYNTALELNQAGMATDFILLCSALEDKGMLEGVGGAAYLATLVDRTPTAAHAEYYAEIIKEKAKRRALIDLGGRLASHGYAEDTPLDLRDANERWLNLTQDETKTLLEVRTMKDYLALDLSKHEAVIGEGLLPFGGRLLLAGAPKLGKSVLTLQLAIALASGTNWLGLFPISRPWHTLYLDFEWAPRVTQERLETMGEHYSVPKEDYWERLWGGSLSPLDILQGGLSTLTEKVQRAMPEVLILDPLARIHTEDENSATAMNKVCNALDRFRADNRLAALIVVHHDRKMQPGFVRQMGDVQNIRGSSTLLAWPESLAIIEADAITGGRRFTFALREQRNISQIVTEYDPTTMLSTGQIVSDQDLTLPTRKILGLLAQEGGRMPRKALLQTLKDSGIPGRTAARALSSLVNAKRVASVKSGDPAAHHRAHDIVLIEAVINF